MDLPIKAHGPTPRNKRQIKVSSKEETLAKIINSQVQELTDCVPRGFNSQLWDDCGPTLKVIYINNHEPRLTKVVTKNFQYCLERQR